MTYQTQYDTQRAIENLTALSRRIQQTAAPEMSAVVTHIVELLAGGYQPSGLILTDLNKQIRIWGTAAPYSPLSSMIFSLHGRDLVCRMEREYVIQRPLCDPAYV